MLVITNDGRKLALDQRLINPMLPDSDTGKVAVCTENVYKIWERTAEKKSTQMVFVDLSTPHNDGQFNVYDDLKKKLLDKSMSRIAISHCFIIYSLISSNAVKANILNLICILDKMYVVCSFILSRVSASSSHRIK